MLATMAEESTVAIGLYVLHARVLELWKDPYLFEISFVCDSAYPDASDRRAVPDAVCRANCNHGKLLCGHQPPPDQRSYR